MLLGLVLALSSASVARAADTPTQTLHVLIRFAAGASAAERAAALRAIGGSVEGEIVPLGVTRIGVVVERGTDAATVLRTIGAQHAVAGVEQDARVHIDWTPNDPLWSTDPYTGLGQWGDRKIALDRARDLVTTLAPVIVAIIDTGVDSGHPDLAGALLPGVTLLSSQSPGCAADATATDDNSHGTHVAGIIAADANNAVGIAGVAPNARILPIKALDCTGSGSVSDIAQAITYAVDHGARVINISLGSSSDSATLEAAVQYAVSRNVLIVAAVGNCGSLTPTSQSRCFFTQDLVEYPGASPGVLGVGATQSDDTIAPFSTHGPQVALTAPGVRIVSTTPRYPTYQSLFGATPGYAAFSGTSQATPFVSGAAALLFGVDPTLTGAQVADRLKATAIDLGAPGTDTVFGAGRIDLLRAVAATADVYSARYDTSFVPRTVTGDESFTAKVALTNTSHATWPASGNAAVKLSYHWLDGNGAAVVWDGARTAFPSDVLPGSTVIVDLGVLAPPERGTYVLRIDLVREGVGWFSSRGVRPGEVDVSVVPGFGAAYAPLTRYVWLPSSQQTPLVVAVENTGTVAWHADGDHPVRLSYHWMQGGVTTQWDGARVSLSHDVQPGEWVVLDLPVIPPEGLAIRTLRLDLVEEGVQWFSAQGVAPSDVLYVIMERGG